MGDYDRRTFLKSTGVALGGLTVGVGVGGASSQSERFLIDLTEVERSAVPDDVEIIHDISQIDVLAARGDPDSIPGAASTMPDVAANQHGPVVEHDASDRGGKGPAWDSGAAEKTEIQWDKREQRLGDLTERPDNRRVVHDTTRGEGTRVAVVDTGVYDDHPDLEGVVNDDLSENYTTDQYDWRPNGAGDHGTHVAGIIAATNDGGDGVLGTAPETEIVAHRVFSGVEGEGAALGDTLAALAEAADKGCDVANFSVGYTVYDPQQYPVLLTIKQLYEDLADYARSQGMTIVNSTGNAGLNMNPENTLSVPTEADGIFGVSATGPIGFLWDDKQESREVKALRKLEEPTDHPAFYTNYGHGTDVSAAGGNVDQAAIGNTAGWYYDLVLSTIYESTEDGLEASYGWKAGTSMSAPQVTGAYALVRSLRPDASPQEVESLIRETASSAPGGELYHGAGHLDLRALIQEASKGDNGKGNG